MPRASLGRKIQPGNLVVGSLLAGLSVIFLCWQSESFLIQQPGAHRILWAIAVTAAYVAGCAQLFLIQRARNRVSNTVQPIGSLESGAERVLVAYASQTGHAETLAGQTAQSLRGAGIHVAMRSFQQLEIGELQATRRALFIVSTTGEGDAPDTAAGFVASVMSPSVQLQDLSYALLALGDSDYTNFCGFGHDLEALLRRAGARALFDTIEVDNGDAGALRLWQYHLGQVSGKSDLPDWQVPEYSRWRLVERSLVNPGSVGDPCFHIALEPSATDLPVWEAGDIVEIAPQQASADVESWLHSRGLDGGASVLVDGKHELLRTVAARSSLAIQPESSLNTMLLPSAAPRASAKDGTSTTADRLMSVVSAAESFRSMKEGRYSHPTPGPSPASGSRSDASSQYSRAQKTGVEVDECEPQQVANSLVRLPHRDYSIASIPSDGRIELLLRQWRRSDGSLGLGTGWMTEHAALGDEISARIRVNNGFHVPKNDGPLLLIGNGTGIASLRALLKQRALENRHRNWLIFGERNADRDFHFGDEILAMQKHGIIERLDLAFSRDQAERIYVQNRLQAAADHVRAWVRDGAEILVCGSLEGMAPGVDDALRHILGSQLVNELIVGGRYRRDLY